MFFYNGGCMQSIRGMMFGFLFLALILEQSMALAFTPNFFHDEGFAPIVERVIPSVVRVCAEFDPEISQPHKHKPCEKDSLTHNTRMYEAGSGVIIDPRGYIVLNNHGLLAEQSVTVRFPSKQEFQANIVNSNLTVTVRLYDGKEFPATIVGRDLKTDLAVIKIEAGILTALSWADPTSVRVGNIVLAVGNPFLLDSSVSLGIVSAIGRGEMGHVDLGDFIQTDAAINAGNSGGALVNLRGELIGINTFVIASEVKGTAGFAFAIPASIATHAITSIIQHGKVVWGWIGVTLEELTPELAAKWNIPSYTDFSLIDGPVVTNLTLGGPAEKAGLQRGDVIVRFNRAPVLRLSDLWRRIAMTPVNTTVPCTIFRDGALREMTIVVELQPDADG